MAAMQARQIRVDGWIKKVAAFDRQELAEAFASAAHAEDEATSYQLWIGVACLVSVLALSLGLSRGVLQVLSDLTQGLARFGKGDFSRPIRATSHDELGDLARHANQMAASLEALGREHDRAEAALKLANRELEAFSYSVAHDLRAPLRGINGFSRALLEDCDDRLDDQGKEYLQRIATAARRMGELIDALLGLSRVARTELHREVVDLTGIAHAVVKQLRSSEPERVVDFDNGEGLVVHGDTFLLRALLENLLGNAWKFTNGRPSARIEFGAQERNGATVYCVQDNGAGFNMAYVEKLFKPFQRLHTANQFAGTGIGLATVQRIVNRHGGRIWAEGVVGQGAAFFFTLSESTGDMP
jgi:light-regulated signal transduction histidine kinase (bacteriophytochrome)